MKLRDIQSIIENIYGLTLNININDYIINKDIYIKIKNQSESNSFQYSYSQKGCLLIRENKGELDLGIYLDSKIIQGLGKLNLPVENINHFSEFFTVTEEISHFLCTVWKAYNNRVATPLELEVQGEIDKYITAYFLFRNISPTVIKKELFINFKFENHLNIMEIKRYTRANNLALRFCNILEDKYIKKQRVPSMIKYLRNFYRLGSFAKMIRLKQLSC